MTVLTEPKVIISPTDGSDSVLHTQFCNIQIRVVVVNGMFCNVASRNFEDNEVTLDRGRDTQVLMLLRSRRVLRRRRPRISRPRSSE